MNETVENTDYVNAGRLNLMRWTYAAVMLLFCCLSDIALIVVPVVHALIFAIRFLNRDVTYHTSIIRKAAIVEKDKFVQACYDREIEKQKPSWFSQFAVYAFVEEKAAIVAPVANIEKPKVSEKIEENWQNIMRESIENEAVVYDLDVTISRPLAKVSGSSNSAIELEVW